jgi:hypothetical protein
MGIVNDSLLERKMIQNYASFDKTEAKRHESRTGRLFIVVILPVELFIFSSEAMLKFYCKNCVTLLYILGAANVMSIRLCIC